MRLLFSFLLTIWSLLGSAVWGSPQSRFMDVLWDLESIHAERRQIALDSDVQSVCITISGQVDLAKVRPRIERKIEEGYKDITVLFAPGIYCFRDEQLYFKNKDYSGVTIRLVGDQAFFLGEGQRYVSSGSECASFSRYNGYVSEKEWRYLSVWGAMLESDRLAEVVDESSQLCRIHYSGLKDMPEEQCKNSHIMLTESFDGKVFKIKYIKGGWVYFTASNLAKLSKDLYNINHDFFSGKRFPKFRLCNTTSFAGAVTCLDGKIRFKESDGPVYESCNTRFFYAESTRFNQLEIRGLVFLNNKESSQLITFKDCDVKMGVFIHDCEFRNIHSDIVEVINTDHVFLRRNYVTENFRWGFRADNRSSDFQVEDNTFENSGVGLRNSACVTCYGPDFYVARNHFRNFGYAAVYAGLHYSTKKNEDVSGIIEYNEISFDAQYREDLLNRTLMDAGAIYLGTVHDRTIVRYNHIHDYVGVYSYNGIYCDDGAFNCKIYGNVITGITRGYCISSRRVAWIEKDPKSRVREANFGNFIAYNLLDGKYKFEGRPGNNRCTKGENILLIPVGKEKPSVSTSNISNQQDDRFVPVHSINEGEINLNRPSYEFLPEFQPLQNYVGQFLH